MADMMTFPDTVEEFMEQYKMTDTKQVYSNGTEYVPIFRMKQWFEHENAQLFSESTTSDLISKFIDGLEKTFAYIREREGGDSVCGLCEYDGAYIGESGDWCNECPGFNKDDCFKLSAKTRKEWTEEIIKALPTAQPERKKGEWIEISSINHTYKCSECGRLLVNVTDGKNNVSKHYPYCHCGADMRGERQK